MSGKLTIKEVAKAAGVSTATISRVLNSSGYVSVDVRKHVLETVERLGYKMNPIARSLKQDRTYGIGFVIPDLTNSYFMRMARELQEQLASSGCYLLFMDSREEGAKEAEALQRLVERKVDAILLAGTGENRQQLQEVQRAGTPLILLDREVAGIQADSVMEDNVQASEEAVSHLLKNGHERVGILLGSKHLSTATERLQGVQAAYDRNGLHMREQLLFQGNFTRESGVEAYRYFQSLHEPPTAIFSMNNEMTFGLYMGMLQDGTPTDQLEVVSFGELEFAPLFPNKLGVIRQDPVAIARSAAELLLKRLDSSARTECEKRLLMPTFQMRRKSEDKRLS
jgi:LacI family transcriptional regulator